jgi:uncharacterized coiled-coil protein SlyX
MRGDADVTAAILSLATTIGNLVLFFQNNKTIDRLSDSVTEGAQMLNQQFDQLNARFASYQKQQDKVLNRLLDVIEKKAD